MVFSSITFLYMFFPVVFLLYYIIPNKFKNMLLLITSMIFYAWGEPVYIILMIITSLVDFYCGYLIEKYEDNIVKKKLILIVVIVINLLSLGFFKYGDFLVSSVNSWFNLTIPLLKLALPIGISFYTFQALSYVLDVYMKQVKAEKSFLDFMTYHSLFPQLIAGPIVRYKTISEELHNRKVTYENFTEGFLRFLKGLGKKVLIANNIGALYTALQSNGIENLSVVGSWIGIIAFGLQIYFDFSGYSDMAIGMGKMFGFSFEENFNYPYIAKSITEFWRRWHISLSTWFRDYVYIPLGGSRCSTVKNIRNIFIVWLLTGVWHGAAWNFMLWGIYFGIILILEKFVWGKKLEKLPNIFRHIYALFFILIGWLIFAFDSLGALGNYARVMFGMSGSSFINSQTVYYILNYAVVIALAIAFSMPISKKVKEVGDKLTNKTVRIVFASSALIGYVGILIISTAYLVDATFNPFLYFRF